MCRQSRRARRVFDLRIGIFLGSEPLPDGGFLFLMFGGVVEVPYEFERLRIARLPKAGENCVVRVLFRGRDERHSRLDFTLFGDADEPLVQVDGYRTVRVGGGGK